MKAPDKPKKIKKQRNHLELLERAALYGPYSGCTQTFQAQFESLKDNQLALSEAMPIALSRHQRRTEKDADNTPQILINLQSFSFHKSPQSESTYLLEVTMSPSQSFHSSAFDKSDLEINYQKRIKVKSDVLKCLSATDQPIRFLLLERSTDKEPTLQSPTSSISSSASPPGETLTASTNLVQCREIAYGSIKYADLMSAIAQATSDRGTVASFELPLHATRFSHPEIGLLSVHFVIDGVLRIRQLLTNAPQP